MICTHLRPVEKLLIADGYHETARGQLWTNHCREWVQYNAYLDLGSLRQQIGLDSGVHDHSITDPKLGTEQGFYCSQCKDGISGTLSAPESTLAQESPRGICEHLHALDTALESCERKSSPYARQAWARGWRGYRVVLDRAELRRKFSPADCVKDWENTQVSQPLEKGFMCSSCMTAIMGLPDELRDVFPHFA